MINHIIDLINNFIFLLSFFIINEKNMFENKLKELLVLQYQKNKKSLLSDNMINNLENPIYSSGRIMKNGDVMISVLEAKDTSITLKVFSSEEIDDVCSEYEYLDGNENCIKVIKK